MSKMSTGLVAAATQLVLMLFSAVTNYVSLRYHPVDTGVYYRDSHIGQDSSDLHSVSYLSYTCAA